ncbi:MAG TPA: hypothetical protein VD995_03305 [Azospirillum sp.]|nr:hypothetical protein [Azospirillum sp.]
MPGGYVKAMAITDDRIKRLPPFLAGIARATSYETAIKLGLSWGGTKRKFAASPSERSKIAKIVGLEHAKIIGNMYPGEQIDIPVLPPPAGSKKELILAMEGAKTRVVAQAVGCTERHVRKVRREIYGDISND